MLVQDLHDGLNGILAVAVGLRSYYRRKEYDKKEMLASEREQCAVHTELLGASLTLIHVVDHRLDLIPHAGQLLVDVLRRLKPNVARGRSDMGVEQRGSKQSPSTRCGPVSPARCLFHLPPTSPTFGRAPGQGRARAEPRHLSARCFPAVSAVLRKRGAGCKRQSREVKKQSGASH